MTGILSALSGRPSRTSVFKLPFFRPKDLLDVEKVVAVQGGALDRTYVRSWMVEMVGEGDDRVATLEAIVASFPS